jgi:hypothetical protein
VPPVSDAGIVSAFLLPLKDGEWSGRMHRCTAREEDILCREFCTRLNRHVGASTPCCDPHCLDPHNWS